MRERKRWLFNKFQKPVKKSEKWRMNLRIPDFSLRIPKFPSRIFRLSRRMKALLAQFKIVFNLFSWFFSQIKKPSRARTPCGICEGLPLLTPLWAFRGGRWCGW
jgi:hypothetical protein